VTRTRLAVATLMIAFAGPALAACGDDDPAGRSGTGSPTGGNTSGSSGGGSPNATSTSRPGSVKTQHPAQEDDVRIQITIDDQDFRATLDDSPTSRDLLDLLPTTLSMRDHGSVEKTGRLPSSLSLEGQPEGADPDVGDVGYYAPGNDLVLYYGDQSYYAGIVVLGRLDEGAAERIANMEGTITATASAR
jgi:hypothetical protein